MFELGARPHPPRELYRAYLAQSHVFIGIYWQQYGWVAPGESVSGLEDEYRLAERHPRLLYIKEPAGERDHRLSDVLGSITAEAGVSYRRFRSAAELADLIENDLALLLTERFLDRPSPPEVPSASLPSPATEIFGRVDEIREVEHRLRTGARAGDAHRDRWDRQDPLGARGRGTSIRGATPPVFVPLAAARDREAAVQAVAERLGARGASGGDRADAVAEIMRDRPALLVLDNLEQIAGIGKVLAVWLEALPDLQVLAILPARAEDPGGAGDPGRPAHRPRRGPGGIRRAGELAGGPAVPRSLPRALPRPSNPPWGTLRRSAMSAGRWRGSRS